MAPRIPTKKIIVPRIATANSLNLRASCQGVTPLVANRVTLESGVPRGYSCHDKPRYQPFYIDTPPLLFSALYLFDARLYKCKTYARRFA
jgi:hypothetical protein